MSAFRQKLEDRVRALQGHPKQVAGGIALGSFMGVSPFIGMQIIISLALAFVFRLSKAAVVVGVLNTNWSKGLLLYPLNYQIGCWLLGKSPLVEIETLLQTGGLRQVIQAGEQFFWPLLAGGIITGSLLALVYYHLVLRLLQNRKKSLTRPSAFALVTGASQGLGKALATELAARGTPLLLTALENEGLKEVSEEIKDRYGVEVYYLETDLSQREGVFDLASWASAHPVGMLINNAGLGGSRAFGDASPEYLDAILSVNVRATALLTRLMLPILLKQERAYILNVASMASFSPFAYKTVYPASKAFIYSFSRGLHQELRSKGVIVSTLHPGPIPTNPGVRERISRQGYLGRLGLIGVGPLAHIAIEGLLKGKARIIPGRMNQINRFLMALIPPSWKLPLLSKVVQRELKMEENGVFTNTKAA